MESVTTPVFSVGCDHRYTAFNSAHATAMKTVYGAEIGVVFDPDGKVTSKDGVEDD